MTKLTQYPEGLDTASHLPNIAGADKMNAPGIKHADQHTLLNQAVIQLQTKLGKNDDPNEASIDYRVRALESGEAGGAGLEEATPDDVKGGDLEIPSKAVKWFKVTAGGVSYAVPGFEILTLHEPTGFATGFAAAVFPTDYVIEPFTQEHTAGETLLFPTKFKAMSEVTPQEN